MQNRMKNIFSGFLRLIVGCIKRFTGFIKAVFISSCNPIERHRFLYGSRWGWIVCSILMIILLIFH